MKLVSFDIGIKNMALCMFDISGSKILIQEWKVLNLMDEEAPKRTCSCLLTPKNKKTPSKICGRQAKYTKTENFYCEKHARSHNEYKIQLKSESPSAIKKMSSDALLVLCGQCAIEPEKNTKKAMVEQLVEHFSKVCFIPINEAKKKNAGETDLITIGKNLKTLLNEIENLVNVDIVVIENQISPIANRMKTIQGMLVQYFIMKDSNVRIEFLSSANKLKDFKPLTNILTEENDKSYKMNKKNGVEYCSRILNENSDFENWTPALETKKKDDLADAFLQGIWYIRNKMNIMRMT
jgi:hypothetical protein